MQAPRPNLKPKESKFVSIFSDSQPDSDISFRDAAEGLLKQSADRYVVGVDNLTVSMDGFSMIDQTIQAEVLLEVLLLQHTGQPDDPINPPTWLTFPSGFRYTDGLPGSTLYKSYQIRNDQTNITTFADVIIRLNEIAAKVHENLASGIAALAGDTQYLELSPTTADSADFEHHLRFSLNVTGRLEIHGSRLFWATHFVHIPIKKYQRIFLGTSWRRHIDQRIISLSPYDGSFGSFQGIYNGTAAEFANLNPAAVLLITDKILVLEMVNGVQRGYVRRWSEIDAVRFALPPNGQAVHAWLAYIRAPDIASKIWQEIKAAFKFQGNIFSTFDRRVCTSLPIKKH